MTAFLHAGQLAALQVPLTVKYDPSEARDARGRWTANEFDTEAVEEWRTTSGTTRASIAAGKPTAVGGHLLDLVAGDRAASSPTSPRAERST